MYINPLSQGIRAIVDRYRDLRKKEVSKSKKEAGVIGDEVVKITRDARDEGEEKSKQETRVVVDEKPKQTLIEVIDLTTGKLVSRIIVDEKNNIKPGFLVDNQT